MKKLNVVLAFMTALVLSGCGSVGDLTVTPYGVVAEKGVEAAKAWCVQREIDIAGARVLGRFVDVPLKLAVAPFEAFVGPVIHGTTAVRDAQCEALQGQ